MVKLLLLAELIEPVRWSSLSPDSARCGRGVQGIRPGNR